MFGKTIKSTFKADLKENFVNATAVNGILTHDNISHLPAPVQAYLIHCGFTGHEIIQNAEVVWAHSHIMMKPKGKWMKLKTLQYNSTESPFRIAYMKAMAGKIIPFEGRDLYSGGRGHMFGKIANMITVFDKKDPQIAQGALVTILAEALLIPGYALSGYVTWEAIDSLSARATIRHMGVEASGVFYFNKAGEMLRFECPGRYYMDPSKGYTLRPFTACTGNYIKQGGLYVPSQITAAWQLPEGEYKYWKGTIKQVRYNISL